MILSLVIFIETLILALINGFMIDNTIVLILFMVINLYFIYLNIKKNGKTHVYIFYVAYILRIITLFVDIYGNNYIQIIGSGADTVAFFNIGKLVASDMSMLTQKLRATPYTNFLGFLIYLVGPSRIYLQYLNIIFLIQTMIVVENIMSYLNLDKQFKIIGLSFIAFFPSSIVYSSILLREQLIILLTLLSLKNFIIWFQEKKIKNFILSIVYILIGTSLHAGIVGVFIVYILYLIKHMKESHIILNPINKYSLFLILLTIFVVINKGFIFDRLVFKDMNDLISKLNPSQSVMGNSAYLSSLKFNNPLQFFLLSPVKIFYFLFSPLIIDWRGVSDIASFLFDSIFYIFSVILIFKYYKGYREKNDIVISFIFMVLITSLIFSMGTYNAGTAMRHRNKLCIIFLLIDLIYMQKKSIVRGRDR